MFVKFDTNSAGLLLSKCTGYGVRPALWYVEASSSFASLGILQKRRDGAIYCSRDNEKPRRYEISSVS